MATVLIKRYANRKLYNTETSRYITLKGIAELIEQGAEVRVVDNETGEDITSVALSQILVDNERAQRAVPRTLRWIRSESSVRGTLLCARSLSTRICESATEVMSSPVSLSTTRTSVPCSISSAMPLSVM